MPEGRLGRLARMARVGASTGAGLLLSRDSAGAAKQAARVLGDMRGLAAKVGQLASYVDGFVPAEHQDAYRGALGALQRAAVRSPPEAVRAVVERELGARVDELFAEWSDEPFASASIGQVHRARLADGREVAVKVQHPGIGAAIESDLANAGMLEGLAGQLVGKHFQTKRLMDELGARFREELDYELEGQRQEAFRALHRDDPSVVVPELVRARSSPRVLTSTLVRGRSLDEVTSLGEAERRRYAEVLWRFVFRSNLEAGMFNADPHPGNYLFQPEGRVAFLDFGCIEPIPPARRAWARRLHRAATRRDEAGFREAARALLETRGGRWEELALDFSRRSFEPLFASPFRIDSAYVSALVELVRARKREVLKLGAGEFVAPPRGMLFMNRLQFGFYSVLARLDVEVDYARIDEAILDGLRAADGREETSE